MTRQEFLSYASEQSGYVNRCPKPADEIALILRERIGIDNISFVTNFIYGDGFNGLVCFNRREEKSRDILKIRINSIFDFNYWRDDIQQYVSEIAVISNCAGLIEELFISEDGHFWNKNNELIAENEEGFFDYLVSVEYDFHPVIAERTYEMLRHFGWYEDRHIDVTDFDSTIKKQGITLSKQQLDFLSEFSGLDANIIPNDYDWFFFTLDEILEYGEIRYTDKIYGGSIAMCESLLKIGVASGENSLYLSSDGRIFTDLYYPLGRTALECINRLVNDIPEFAKPK